MKFSTFLLTLSIIGIAAAAPAPALAGNSSGTWSQTGAMSAARIGHTATLLNNGLVLVAGGANGRGGILAGAELYNPATGQWAVTGSMSAARAYHTATLLAGGEVLVTGGQGAGAGAELYNPSTGRWFATGSMTQGRSHHAAVTLDDGQVLVAGGLDSAGNRLAGAELYNPATDTWTATANMNVARAFAAATLMPDGDVLIAGGNANTSAAGHSAELYSKGQWRLTATMSYERNGDTATLLPNGAALVFGGGPLSGGDGACYVPSTGSWVSTNGFATAPPVQGQTQTMLGTGEVMVVGGVDRYQDTSPIAFLYEPHSNRWQTSGAMKQARSQHAATRLDNGQVLVSGGELVIDSNGVVTTTVFASAELYTP